MGSGNAWVNYALFGVAAAFLLQRVLAGISARRRIPEILARGAPIIDVRSPGEFAAGHASNSRNIPLADLETRAEELNRSQWVIVCCASGARSIAARRLLLRHGFTRVLNAGSWRNLPARTL